MSKVLIPGFTVLEKVSHKFCAKAASCGMSRAAALGEAMELWSNHHDPRAVVGRVTLNTVSPFVLRKDIADAFVSVVDERNITLRDAHEEALEAWCAKHEWIHELL